MKNNLYKNNLVPINLKNKHILRIMKMVFISLFVFISGIFATEANSQNTKISISKDNANIQEVINAIEKQTDYLFIYNKKEVNVNQRVSVHATNKTVAEVLHNIFENTEISYAMQGNNIMLMKERNLKTTGQLRFLNKVVKQSQVKLLMQKVSRLSVPM